MKLNLIDEKGESHSLEVANDEFQRVGHGPVGARSSGLWVLREANSGRQQPVAWARKPDGVIEVWLNGRIHRFRTEDSSARRQHGGRQLSDKSELNAGMPGTIVAIRVAVGETVTAGQAVIVMESMKMELTLEAPRAGQVESIACQPGQLVEMGALLLKIAQ